MEIREVRKKLQTKKMEETKGNFLHVHTVKRLHILRNIAGIDLIFNAGHVSKQGIWRRYAKTRNKVIKLKLYKTSRSRRSSCLLQPILQLTKGVMHGSLTVVAVTT
jgi:hypothetical protein